MSLILQNVDLTTQNIIEILKDLGKPEVQINFLKYHIEFINNIFKAKNINSHGAPIYNKVHLCCSKVYYLGNDHHDPFILITAVHIPTGLPIFIDSISSNTIDSNTIDKIVKTLNDLGCAVSHISIDVGYKNISCVKKIVFNCSTSSYVTLFDSNFNLFNNLIDEAIENFDSKSNLYQFDGIFFKGKKIYIDVKDLNDSQKDVRIFIYIYRDFKSQYLALKELNESENLKNITIENYAQETRNYGIFTLISDRDIPPDHSLAEYYSRLSIDQYSDKIKNDLDSLQIKADNSTIFHGHILLIFIASFFSTLLKRRLILFDEKYLNISPTYNDNTDILQCDPAKNKSDIIEQKESHTLATMSFEEILEELSTIHATAFNGALIKKLGNIDLIKILISPVSPLCNDLYTAFGLSVPLEIDKIHNEINIKYDKDLIGNTKALAFVDRPCEEDLNRLPKNPTP